MRFENRNRNQLKTSANMDHTIITCQYICNVIGLVTNNQANAIIAEVIGALEDFKQFMILSKITRGNNQSNQPSQCKQEKLHSKPGT